jgi:hypothetical protein
MPTLENVKSGQIKGHFEHLQIVAMGYGQLFWHNRHAFGRFHHTGYEQETIQ